MNTLVIRIISVPIVLILLAWCAFWLATPINLATADLGRHLKNGELIMTNWTEQGQLLLSTNYYSYTHPDYPVINHHWGTGAIYYLLTKQFGLKGLHYTFIAITLLTFLIFLDLSRRRGNLTIATLIAIPLVPIIVSRAEVRPEAFSYFFIGLFLWLLWQYQQNKISRHWLWLLPILEIAWVNLHIYFIFGPVLITIFLLPYIGRILWLGASGWDKLAGNIKHLGRILGVTSLVMLLSPHFIRGVFQLVTFFNNYGYRIVENQSIPFLQQWGMTNPNFLIVKLTIAITFLSFLAVLIVRRRLASAPLIIAILFSTLAWLAIRNFTIFGLIMLPILASNLSQLPWQRIPLPQPNRRFAYLAVLLIIAAATYFYNFQAIADQQNILGIGPIPEIDKAAQFIKDNNITGPIFNNYDIGGYLIYYLFPQEKVFVDNRPEAYPKEFFEETYIPMQQDNAIWRQQLNQYNFNTIVFWRHDLTEWSQQFMLDRVQDDEWIPIYVDPFTLIFIRNLPDNQSLIDQFELPAQMFSTGS